MPRKPSHAQTFLTVQPKLPRKEEIIICLNNNSAFRDRNSPKFWIIVTEMSSQFIHITNFKINITNPITLGSQLILVDTKQKIKTYHDFIAYSFLSEGCFCYSILPCFPKHIKSGQNLVTKISLNEKRNLKIRSNIWQQIHPKVFKWIDKVR